jgi:hypothetical protein
MKKYNILLAILALVFASLACQTVMGGGNTPTMPEPPAGGNDGGAQPPPQPTIPPIPGIPTFPPMATNDNGNITIGGESEFPLPDDAVNVVNIGNDVVNFQTKLSLKEGMKFYRDQFGKLGYVERKEMTSSSATTFSMVFDGHKSGKAITVQGFDMGDGSTNISITLVDL